MDRLVCLDSFTNSIRTFREKTLNGIGLRQKKFASPAYKFTNNYFGGICGDGVNRFPFHMYSLDKSFGPNSPVADEVDLALQELNLSPDRIHWKKSSKYYCAENKEQIGDYAMCFGQELRGCHLLHDGGPAYKKKQGVHYG